MSELSLVIKNAHVVNHSSEFTGWIGIKGEKIVACGTGDLIPNAKRVINCEGKIVLPGVVDPHVHLGAWHDKGEDLFNETKCAASGGVTTICWYYRTPSSYFDEFEKIRELINRNAHVDVCCHMGIQSEEHARSIPALYDAYGIRCFKLHMGYPKDNALGLNPADDGILYLSMLNAAKTSSEIYISLHAEDIEVIERLARELKDKGRDDLAAWTESRPAFCEEEVIRRAIFFAEVTGSNLYLPHTSIAAGVELAAEARGKGLNVVVETCPHYLTLFMNDNELGVLGKVNPPLRTKTEAAKLWKSISKGLISCIGSDHVAANKLGTSTSIWEGVPGFAGVETLLPIMLSEGVHAGRISLQKLVEVCCYNPAKLFGLYPRKGSISIGADADLVIVDLNRREMIKQDNMHSDSTIPYNGKVVTGWPIMTILRGEVIAEEGQIKVSGGYGKYVQAEGTKN